MRVAPSLAVHSEALFLRWRLPQRGRVRGACHRNARLRCLRRSDALSPRAPVAAPGFDRDRRWCSRASAFLSYHDFQHTSRRRLGSPLLGPIHQSAWKVYSPNFRLTEFSRNFSKAPNLEFHKLDPLCPPRRRLGPGLSSSAPRCQGGRSRDACDPHRPKSSVPESASLRRPRQGLRHVHRRLPRRRRPSPRISGRR